MPKGTVTGLSIYNYFDAAGERCAAFEGDVVDVPAEAFDVAVKAGWLTPGEVVVDAATVADDTRDALGGTGNGPAAPAFASATDAELDEMTVVQLNAYADEHESERARIYDFEVAGKQRKGVLDHLASLET